MFSNTSFPDVHALYTHKEMYVAPVDLLSDCSNGIGDTVRLFAPLLRLHVDSAHLVPFLYIARLSDVRRGNLVGRFALAEVGNIEDALVVAAVIESDGGIEGENARISARDLQSALGIRLYSLQVRVRPREGVQQPQLDVGVSEWLISTHELASNTDGLNCSGYE
ncbi:hypothetical protein PMAYCL1PPCAC_17195 [Pristionchus mayeri]|uniref:Uncharacterized protein n=1 Tax=Pristionchus mayeri TaxID=1317129 RepID=A0AAN5CM62_9BILA|nr:hypothetical protein PMAYCL1PPCAC_17179 [Pristionchus mayeri]GMR46991.1 hypothetical protein PMAYCL1PPCAC_17186 [Pristionchus mayeri]GMR47000.1 hypothetical protein PMAYCL1PPCAC_17195 [Pristionchus mayeri]